MGLPVSIGNCNWFVRHYVFFPEYMFPDYTDPDHDIVPNGNIPNGLYQVPLVREWNPSQGQSGE